MHAKDTFLFSFLCLMSIKTHVKFLLKQMISFRGKVEQKDRQTNIENYDIETLQGTL